MADDRGPDESAEPMVWKIAFRDDIRAHMATSPPPHFARTEADRDWWLKTTTRPLDEFTVEQVPGPIERAIADETERWNRVKRELRAEAREKFLRGKREET